MKKVYTTTMSNTGGRSGESHSPNHSFEVNIEEPGSKTAGTNPEGSGAKLKLSVDQSDCF